MEWLVILGAVLTLTGLAGLVRVIMIARAAKKEGLEGDAMTARLRSLVAWNLGALAFSSIGLMCVVFGVVLG